MNDADTLARSQVVTAFFRKKEDADRAVNDLAKAGLDRSQISIVAGGATSPAKSQEEMGFWESLKDLFLPDDDRHVYAEGLRRGGYVVAVRAAAGEYDRVLSILDRDGSVDLGSEETAWRSEGWRGNRAGTSNEGRMFGDDREQVIPVTEEELRVGKRDVSHGRVRVRSYVVETPVEESVTLHEEQVDVERRPVDRAVTAGDVAFDEKTIEVEERSEEAVVSKDARVKEEVVVRKTADDRTKTISDTVRSTKVEVDDTRQPRGAARK